MGCAGPPAARRRLPGTCRRNSGAGQLTAFGAGRPTRWSCRVWLAVARLGLSCEFDVVPVAVGPGVLGDVFAVDSRAIDRLGNRDEIDAIVVVPMRSMRLGGGAGPVTAMVELGSIRAEPRGPRAAAFSIWRH